MTNYQNVKKMNLKLLKLMIKTQKISIQTKMLLMVKTQKISKKKLRQFMVKNKIYIKIVKITKNSEMKIQCLSDNK